MALRYGFLAYEMAQSMSASDRPTGDQVERTVPERMRWEPRRGEKLVGTEDTDRGCIGIREIGELKVWRQTSGGTPLAI
jgi:hypothetical protein